MQKAQAAANKIGVKDVVGAGFDTAVGIAEFAQTGNLDNLVNRTAQTASGLIRKSGKNPSVNVPVVGDIDLATGINYAANILTGNAGGIVSQAAGTIAGNKLRDPLQASKLGTGDYSSTSYEVLTNADELTAAEKENKARQQANTEENARITKERERITAENDAKLKAAQDAVVPATEDSAYVVRPNGEKEWFYGPDSYDKALAYSEELTREVETVPMYTALDAYGFEVFQSEDEKERDEWIEQNSSSTPGGQKWKVNGVVYDTEREAQEAQRAGTESRQIESNTWILTDSAGNPVLDNGRLITGSQAEIDQKARERSTVTYSNEALLRQYGLMQQDGESAEAYSARVANYMKTATDEQKAALAPAVTSTFTPGNYLDFDRDKLGNEDEWRRYHGNNTWNKAKTKVQEIIAAGKSLWDENSVMERVANRGNAMGAGRRGSLQHNRVGGSNVSGDILRYKDKNGVVQDYVVPKMPSGREMTLSQLVGEGEGKLWKDYDEVVEQNPFIVQTMSLDNTNATQARQNEVSRKYGALDAIYAWEGTEPESVTTYTVNKGNTIPITYSSKQADGTSQTIVPEITSFTLSGESKTFTPGFIPRQTETIRPHWKWIAGDPGKAYVPPDLDSLPDYVPLELLDVKPEYDTIKEDHSAKLGEVTPKYTPPPITPIEKDIDFNPDYGWTYQGGDYGEGGSIGFQLDEAYTPESIVDAPEEEKHDWVEYINTQYGSDFIYSDERLKNIKFFNIPKTQKLRDTLRELRCRLQEPFVYDNTRVEKLMRALGLVYSDERGKDKRFYVQEEIKFPKGFSIKAGQYITGVKVMYEGDGIRDVHYLVEKYPLPNGKRTNPKDWQKVRGTGLVTNGRTSFYADIHWYYCPNIGKIRFKIKVRDE